MRSAIQSPSSKNRPVWSGKRPGFALVVTISLMVLLTILGVGLLTLSVITLRSSAGSAAQTEAQANARLALLLAIGELQKQAGSDQRITANAGILDESPGTAGIEGVNAAYKRIAGIVNLDAPL